MASGKLTPFMIFYLERRDVVKNLVELNKGDCRPEDISRQIAKLWSELDFESIRGYCLLSNLYAEMVAKHGPANSSRSVKNNFTGTSHSSGNNSRGVRGLVGIRRRMKHARKNSRLLKRPRIVRTIGTLWKTANVVERRPVDDLAAEGAPSQADTMTAHPPCAKRRRMEEASRDASDMSMSTESLPPPPPKPLDAMRGVGTTVGCTAYPSQQMPPCEGGGSLP